MIRRLYSVIFVTLILLKYTQSLQSGFTCETSVTLTCPENTKLLILEVAYSSECPNLNEEKTGGAVNPPSQCIGYYREHASSLCNGQTTCTIDNNLEQRPSFLVGKQSNCEFRGQSMNVDFSCIPEFLSSKLPRIDICSLESLHDLKEGFIHTPNYPNGYPNSRTCSKTVPSPDIGHRLKIYALNFDVEGLSVLRFFGIKRANDWLQINNSGERMFGSRPAYTLLFDDIIEASLMFKSDFANTKRPYIGFLLYFIVTPIQAFRPIATSTIAIAGKTTAITVDSVDSISHANGQITTLSESKTFALLSNDRQSNQNHAGLTILVVLLSGVLIIILFVFILYKRRNDRRVRYLTDLFNTLFLHRQNDVKLNTADNGDETILNKTTQSKLDLSLITDNEKFTKMNDYSDQYLPEQASKHVNINEKRNHHEKQIFIENLKTCPSPYSSYRRTESKINAKELINNHSNIYSKDPLENKKDRNSIVYEDIDINQVQQTNDDGIQEVIYDVINPNNERPVPQETDYDSTTYATPKDI